MLAFYQIQHKIKSLFSNEFRPDFFATHYAARSAGSNDILAISEGLTPLATIMPPVSRAEAHSGHSPKE